MKAKHNGVRSFFTYTGERPNEMATCKHCHESFRLRDRNGRVNYGGLNSHLSGDVTKARMRGQIVP